MADISLCRNKECPMRDECYRATATPSKFRQWYSSFTPVYNPEENKVECDHYWPLDKK
jgi:hypothetical protein